MSRAVPKYTVKELAIQGKTVTIPHSKRRTVINVGEWYTLTEEDIRQDRGQIWANLAFKFYGNPLLFTILVDNNPVISDFHLYEGIRVFIPEISE